MEYTIICAIDGGESSSAILERAFAEARHHPLAFVHLVTVAPKAAKDDVEAQLRGLVAEILPTFATDSGSRKVFVHSVPGEVVPAVLDLAMEQHADLLIVGHSSADGDSKPGETAAQIIEQTPCSVLTIRTPEYVGQSAKQCPACVEVRRDSKGETLFCKAHQSDRIPRLMERVGGSHYVSGWGLF